jgi:HK97 family phage portal protein
MASLLNLLGFSRKAKSDPIPTAAEAAILSRLPDEKGRDFIEYRIGVPIHKFTDYNSYITAGSKKVWAAMRAVRLISATAISANFKIVDTTAADDSLKVPISPKDPDTVAFAKGRFLTKPNPYDTWEDLIDMTVAHLEFAGNAYWLKDDTDLLGRPSSLFPLLPQNIKWVPSRTEKIAAYVYSVNGHEITFNPDQIIHFRYTHPGDLMAGLGTMEAGEDLYRDSMAQTDIRLKFKENGAQPSGVMTLDDGSVSDEAEWEKLRKKFQSEYGGKKNAGKTAFLNGKWSYHKLGLTMSEMQSLEESKWTIEQIFLNHGVPLSIAGVQGAANYATARQDEMNFRRYKIVPLIDIIVGKINADGFIQKVSPTFKLVYELYGVIDTEQISKTHLPLLREGVITRNEFRELLGFRRIENPLMDQIMVMNHTIPIEFAGLASLSNEDMLRAYGQIVGGDVEEITDEGGGNGSDGDDGEEEEDDPKGITPPIPPKKSKSYPAKPKKRRR